MLAVTRTEATSNYNLVLLDRDGTKQAEKTTIHTQSPRIIEIPSGFLLISHKGHQVLITEHTTKLESKTRALSIEDKEDELVDIAVSTYPVSGPAEAIASFRCCVP